VGREPVLGTFIQMADPLAVEMLSRTGFDFAILDLEHGGLTFEGVLPILRAADIVRFPLLARLPVSKLAMVDQLLDSGVAGILVARVATVEDARAAVRAVRYPPAGERGACPGTRANEFGALSWPEHLERASTEIVLGLALEGGEGISNAEEISAVPGIDLVFVGVFDLAASLGLPGQTDHPSVVEAVRTIAARSEHNGIAAGTWSPSIDVAQQWLEQGATFLPVSTDVRMWREACLATTGAWSATVRRAAVHHEEGGSLGRDTTAGESASRDRVGGPHYVGRDASLPGRSARTVHQ
jgi:4-hydroxy-2-oxoheptanedioate aldolase